VAGPSLLTANRTARLGAHQGHVQNCGKSFQICKFGEDDAQKMISGLGGGLTIAVAGNNDE
jgi:hypothetical protein